MSALSGRFNSSVCLSSICKGVPTTETRCKTKIICTLGPKVASVEQLTKLINGGMDIARLNFSHGDHEYHANMTNLLREASKESNKEVALLLDTKGPEIRTGFLATEDKKVSLEAGQDLRICTDYSFLGDNTCIACSYKDLPQTVKVGSTILMADGSFSLLVKETLEDSVIVEVLNSGILGERKNMNLPGVAVNLPIVAEKDIDDILNFGIPHVCHFIALSFVQRADDIRKVRELLGGKARHVKIISKIENTAGLQNYDEILKETDGIMVARGDLGMEIPPDAVFVAQKLMIQKANLAGKFVVTATQMLESMINNPRPTRAEASDVANAVLDGTDCVMLSGETANGMYPVESVTMMEKICRSAEQVIDYPLLLSSLHEQCLAINHVLPTAESVCSAAVKTALDCGAKLIIALTETGSTAQMIAKYRPSQTILALTASEFALNHMAAFRGVTAIEVASFQGTDNIIRKALAYAKEQKLVSVNDRVVAVHGVKEELSGHTNLMKVITVT